MAACISSRLPSSSLSLSTDFLPNRAQKPSSLSWVSFSFCEKLDNLSLNSLCYPSNRTLSQTSNGGQVFSCRFSENPVNLQLEIASKEIGSLHINLGFVVQAAWTRRSRHELAKKPNRKSWKQRTDMYMRPFQLNVFFSKRFVHAKVMHRGTSKVISVATTNSKELRFTLPSLTDNNACRVIGKLIAERSKDADVFAVAFETKKNERVEGRLGIILDTIQENGILFV